MEKIWLKHYPLGVPEQIDTSTYRSLNHLFQDSVEKYGHKVAFSHASVSIRYSELNRWTAYFAQILREKLGLPAGAHVGLMLPNLLQYPIALFGALRAGCRIVNINPLYTAYELEHIFQDAQLDVILVLEPFVQVLDTALSAACLEKKPRIIISSLGDMLGFKGFWMNLYLRWVQRKVPSFQRKGRLYWKDLFSSIPLDCVYSPEDLGPEDIAFLQYTGGTTGVLKAAVLTHGNMVANVLQARAWVSPSIEGSKEAIITALPLYHIFSLMANVLTFFSLGFENILIANPKDIPSFIALLKKRSFSFITGVNTLFAALLNHPHFKNISFSSLKIALGGGMGIQAAVAKRWFECTGVPLVGAYGLTETSPAVCIFPPGLGAHSLDKMSSVGLPLPSTELSIRDPQTGEECPIGMVGECWVRGPQVMREYWNHPEETQEVLKEGWLYTGDLVKIDEEGYVTVVDRKKDLILVSGFNVYPNEVEAVLAQHPKVKEIAIVGVPLTQGDHEVEIVKAFVVPTDLSLTPEELVDYARQYLTSYKIPKVFEFMTSLPRSPVGKILRRLLKQRHLKTEPSAS